MTSRSSRPLLLLVVATIATLLVGGCSTSSPPPTPKPTSTTESPKQQFIDTVNGLCDKLEPEVIRATHGGSIDIPASQYVKDWPAHEKALSSFDASLADVSPPPSAASAADALKQYVAFADKLDDARLKAAKQGEGAWRREVAAEKNAANDPAIAGLTKAGFADSCQAR